MNELDVCWKVTYYRKWESVKAVLLGLGGFHLITLKQVKVVKCARKAVLFNVFVLRDRDEISKSVYMDMRYATNNKFTSYVAM